ncbi:hypothetical protein R1sor_005353 [Riccia sorocarpa]|uniref:Uncharacterized protein n=1 Tax=Riccia sorocarpa TaxID=122646 RepID=A0ABD3HM99_9MARC
MARCKQTALRKPKAASGQRVEVDASEVTFPDGVQRTGKVTLVRFDVPDSPAELRISSPQEDIGVNEHPSSSRPYRDHISSSSSSSEDTEMTTGEPPSNLPSPTSFQLDRIEIHDEAYQTWAVDYLKRARYTTSEIVLKLNAEDKKGHVRAKELGIVFYACKANAGFIELW